MATTAGAYGFGARAPYAQPRASDYEMQERVRLSGLFPRVRNEPMSTQLQVLLKEFEQNAALTGILERRRRLEERMQFELKGREGMDALNTNLAPPFRAGLAGAAVSADVADRLARSRVAGQWEAARVAATARMAAQRAAPADQAAAAAAAVPDAAAVMTGGVYSTGGSTGSGLVRPDKGGKKAGGTSTPVVAPGTPLGGISSTPVSPPVLKPGGPKRSRSKSVSNKNRGASGSVS